MNMYHEEYGKFVDFGEEEIIPYEEWLENQLTAERAKTTALEKQIETMRNMLEDVVNELDLSEIAIKEHGQNGTPPAQIVKSVLEEKDRIISGLKAGIRVIKDGET